MEHWWSVWQWRRASHTSSYPVWVKYFLIRKLRCQAINMSRSVWYRGGRVPRPRWGKSALTRGHSWCPLASETALVAGGQLTLQLVEQEWPLSCRWRQSRGCRKISMEEVDGGWESWAWEQPHLPSILAQSLTAQMTPGMHGPCLLSVRFWSLTWKWSSDLQVVMKLRWWAKMRKA